MTVPFDASAPDAYTGLPVPTVAAPLAPVGSADVPLVPKPDEPYVPTPRYDPPLVRNVRVGPIWVSACRCPSCGSVYAHQGGLASDAPEPVCLRCQYVTLTPTAEARDAMVKLRRLYDAYVYAKGLNGVSQEQQRAAFVQVHDACWRLGPTLLQELERVFGAPRSAPAVPDAPPDDGYKPGPNSQLAF